MFVYRFMWNIWLTKWFCLLRCCSYNKHTEKDTADRRTILRFPPCSPKQPCGRLVLSPLRQRWKDGKANWRGWHCTFTLKPKQSFWFQGTPERQWNFQDTETSRKNNSLSIQEICNNKKLDFIHFKDDNIYLVTFTDMNTASKLLHRISSNSDRQCL